MADSNVVELCILSDATTSMGPYMKQVKEDISKIISESQCQFGIDSFRVAFVGYRDWIGKGKRLETLPFTTNIESFEEFVSNLKEEGGDDAAEDVLGGLQEAINLDWTASIKILYHIADAPPHGTMYHDLYDTKTAQIDSMLSTIDELMKMEDDNKYDNESSSEEEENINEYNNAFITSKIQYKLTEEERITLDRFPDKHINDPDHMDLLKLIKIKGIQYCIGAKTSHVDKFINIMIKDAEKIDLKVNRKEVSDIKTLFPSVLGSIEYALREVENINIEKNKQSKIYRPLTISQKGNFKVHCGIDFGTDGSAISLLLPSTGKVVIYEWGSNKEFTKTKTNILINPKDGKILAFGTNAAIRYENLMQNLESDSEYSDNDNDEYINKKNSNAPLFFEHFKMALYKNENNNICEMKENKENKENDEGKKDISEYIRAAGGRTYSSLKVLEAALTFMKDKVLSIVKEKPYFVNNISEIQWILTVPAIWSNKSKYIMERCAYNSGMINKKENIFNHLIIAYEPDCASISIRNSYSDLTKKYNKKTKSNAAIFETGDKYLLLDLGGGTADIATHEIVDNYHVKQIRSPSGGPWGSSFIDKEFEKLLKNIFKKEWINKFEKKYPEKYISLLRSFRFKKEKFKFDLNVKSSRFDENKYRNYMEIFTMNSLAYIQYSSQYKDKNERKFHEIPVSYEFIEEIGKYISIEMKRILNRNNNNNNNNESDSDMDENEYVKLYLESHKLFGEYKYLIKLENEMLCFEESILRYLFDLIIDKIIGHCKYLLSQINSIKYICLVGGFSESKYLQSKIFYEFGPSSRFKKKILTPKKPILCVVDGAARYGLKLNYIISRNIPKTYGIKIQKSLYKFVKLYPNIKINNKQIINKNNTQWINNYFLPFVRKNDIIRIDDKPKIFYFKNVDKNAKKIIIKLYESNIINPIFTNQKNVKLCAEKEYILPNEWIKNNNNNNTIPVRFYFGYSTIRVFVDIEGINDNEKEIKLNFDTK